MARVVFVQDLHYEIPAVMALSAALRRAGHEPWVVLGAGRRAARAVARDRPDVVALSLMSYHEPWARELVVALRRAGVTAPVLAGGIHPTLAPDAALALGVDAVCRGEGDVALPAAVEALAAGRGLDEVPGFSGPGFATPPEPLCTDLDALPYLDRSVYDRDPFLRRFRMRIAVASRGCPFACTFCANPHVHHELYPRAKRWYRVQSPERVLDEVAALIRGHRPKIVRFLDDLFGADPDWLSRFLAGYRRRGLTTRFQFNTHATVLPPALVPELVRTGCDSIVIGVESGNPEIRCKVLGKRIPDEAFRALAAACHQHGLRLGTNNIFGLPGETLDDALSTVALNAELKPHRISSDILKLYPGLAITAQALEQGVLRREDLGRYGESAFKTRRSLLRQPGIDAVTNVHKLSHLGARVPALLPVIRRLAKLPPNPGFDALFYATSFLEFARDDLAASPVETLLRLVLSARAVI